MAGVFASVRYVSDGFHVAVDIVAQQVLRNDKASWSWSWSATFCEFKSEDLFILKVTTYKGSARYDQVACGIQTTCYLRSAYQRQHVQVENLTSCSYVILYQLGSCSCLAERPQVWSAVGPWVIGQSVQATKGSYVDGVQSGSAIVKQRNRGIPVVCPETILAIIISNRPACRRRGNRTYRRAGCKVHLPAGVACIGSVHVTGVLVVSQVSHIHGATYHKRADIGSVGGILVHRSITSVPLGGVDVFSVRLGPCLTSVEEGREVVLYIPQVTVRRRVVGHLHRTDGRAVV